MIDAIIGLAVGLPVAAAVSGACFAAAGLLTDLIEWLWTWRR